MIDCLVERLNLEKKYRCYNMKKSKRKYMLKIRRQIKKSKGIFVPFSLSNCSKKLSGIKNRYEYKCNVHNCIFKEATFEHVRYRAGHITFSNFRKSKFINVDFIYVNLKNNKFENSNFKNCLFYGCNFSNSNFDRAQFENCIFINCKFKCCKNMLQKNLVVNYNDIYVPSTLTNTILSLDKIEKYSILTTNKKSVNKIISMLLLQLYSTNDLNRALKIINNWHVKILTFYDYKIYLKKYLKK